MHISVSELRSLHSIELSEVIDKRILGDLPDFVSFKHPLQVQVKASLTGSEIIADGNVATKVTFICARCLDGFERDMKVFFQESFEVHEEKIDLSGPIREAVLVEIPLKALCKDDCKGLCQNCGKNRNQVSCACHDPEGDPRWRQLSQYRFE